MARRSCLNDYQQKLSMMNMDVLELLLKKIKEENLREIVLLLYPCLICLECFMAAGFLEIIINCLYKKALEML